MNNDVDPGRQLGGDKDVLNELLRVTNNQANMQANIEANVQANIKVSITIYSDFKVTS